MSYRLRASFEPPPSTLWVFKIIRVCYARWLGSRWFKRNKSENQLKRRPMIFFSYISILDLVVNGFLIKIMRKTIDLSPEK